MNDVSEWEEECGFVSYDPRYEDGWNHCNSNDVGYELSPYETSIEAANYPQGSEGFGIFSNDEKSIRGCDFARGSRGGMNYSYGYPDPDSQQILEQPPPHSGACKGTNYNYESCYQVNGYVHDYNCSYSVIDSAGMRNYVHDYSCDCPIPAMFSMQYEEYKIDCEHANFDDSSNYSAAYNDDSYVRNSDNCDVKHDYWVPEITSMRNIEHEIDFRDVAPNEGVKIAAGNVFDTCFESDFGHSPSIHNIAAPTGFHAKLDLCVKRHELCVQEHELWVQERAIIRKDLNSLRSRLDRLIEEEKCKKLEASFLCLERQKLGDDVVAFMDDQGLEGNEVKLVDKISSNERVEETDLVEISEENEGKTELSLGLISAMRCLELQRKIWAMGSFMSVIPAVPLHHFEDPFLAEVKKVEVIPSPFATTCLRTLLWGDVSHVWEPLSAANYLPSRHILFTPHYESSVALQDLLIASGTQHLQREWIVAILSTWHTLWRPPDVGVQFGASCRSRDPWFLTIICALLVWFAWWRPPELICRYWRLGTNMLGWCFDRGRPPDGWTLLVSTVQLRGRSPSNGDGMMHS